VTEIAIDLPGSRNGGGNRRQEQNSEQRARLDHADESVHGVIPVLRQKRPVPGKRSPRLCGAAKGRKGVPRSPSAPPASTVVLAQVRLTPSCVENPPKKEGSGTGVVGRFWVSPTDRTVAMDPMLSMRGTRAPAMPALPFIEPRYLRALAIRYSASASIGPPLSARSRRTSSRTTRRISSGNAASAWPVEAPPRSKGP
jgi:hypothetical protein